MWFNAKAKLAEIAGGTPATSATTATQAPPVSQKSQVSQALVAETEKSGGFYQARHVAKVAEVATPTPQTSDGEFSRQGQSSATLSDAFRHGRTIGGRCVTWTGRVVSLEEWGELSEWDRHGPNGRHWCGLSQPWKGEQR